MEDIIHKIVYVVSIMLSQMIKIKNQNKFQIINLQKHNF